MYFFSPVTAFLTFQLFWQKFSSQWRAMRTCLIIPFLSLLWSFPDGIFSHEHLHISDFAILTGQVEICSLNGEFKNGSFVCENLSLFCSYQSHWFKYIWICLFLCKPISIQHLIMFSLLGDVTQRHCLLRNARFFQM